MDKYITQPGEIEVREIKRGLAFYASNFQRQKIHIGTLSGQTYEKRTAVLWTPEPSISLTENEYSAAMEAGAVYLRCVFRDRSETYSISLTDFRKFSAAYFHPVYGDQLRTPLEKFSRISAVTPRNLITDNPVIQGPTPTQLPLFWRP